MAWEKGAPSSTKFLPTCMPLEPGTIEVPITTATSLIPLSTPATAAAAAAAAAVAAAAAASAPPHNPRERKLRSAVWNDFSKQRRSDGTCVAICNHCQKQLTASSRSGTTHLRNHLAICLSTKPRPGPGRRKKLVVRRLLVPAHSRKHGANTVVTTDGDDTNACAADSTPVVPFDQDASQQDLARMIVRHGYRFSMVDDVGFRTFVHNLQPQFKMAPYDAVKADCMRIYDNTKLKLQGCLRKLPSRVSLSVDTWRSSTGTEYICLTCHFIEQPAGCTEWKLRKKILNFIHVESGLNPELTSKRILEKIHEWGLHKKLTSIVLDNCTAGDMVGQEIIRILNLKGLLLLKGELFLVRSCAHVLNLTVQESLEQAVEMTSRVRACIQYVKFSQDRFARFQKYAKQSGLAQKPLILDSPNNWTTTYSMFDSACHYQDVFGRLAEWDPEFPGLLNPKDWADVKALTDILDVLYHTMEKFPATENPTANLCFNELCGIHYLLKTWCTSPSPVVAAVASQMLLKLETYWDLTKTLMAITSILDPRYKMKSIEYFFKQMYSTDTFEAKSRTDEIRKTFINLYNEYAVQSAGSSKNPAVLCYAGNSGLGGGSGTGSGTNYNNRLEESKTFSRITLSDARRGLDQYIQESSTGQSLKTDLDMYLEEPVYRTKEEGAEFDILGWWRSFSAKYPVLSCMARDMLAIPVSIVPLDGDARLLNEYLSTMDSSTVQGLICAQDWLRDEPDVVDGVHGTAASVPSTNADDSPVNVQALDYSASPK
ncbi:hypothetical protein LUZ63_018794 [Rhynchospora breviuscula]|uniref:BED-type domain-containing protein n=1 Tax=Rhynchospora breviuscula TaxID=2022672 RepID=A0A9Q0HIH8_9POAL|nr:hypothetical protein LUZ63_018794 [Rhynchospora breviuscula]